MTTDGGLARILQAHLPDLHWQTVETTTSRGVPDLNYCGGGVEGWIECKRATSWRVEVRAEQVAWMERRVRAGGRTFVAVRRQVDAGPRRGESVDQFLLFRGAQIRALLLEGVRGPASLLSSSGGPAAWDWPGIRQHLLGF